MGKGTMGDAVDSPRTVMVHFWDASANSTSDIVTFKIRLFCIPLADFTMVRPRRFESLASSAPSLSFSNRWLRTTRYIAL
jgi:hypothetical protein